MIAYTVTVRILEVSELVLVLVYLMLLVYELQSFWKVITKPQTILLVSFLNSLTLVHVCRLIGLLTNNILIRTYFSAIFGLFAALFLVNWGSSMIEMRKRSQFLFYFSLLSLSSLFFVGRKISSQVVEMTGLLGSILVTSVLMFRIFRYVFRKSPYVLARKKLFMLSISFVTYCIFEAFFINYLRTENFLDASFIIVFLILTRFFMTVSIFMPSWLSEKLSFMIK